MTEDDCVFIYDMSTSRWEKPWKAPPSAATTGLESAELDVPTGIANGERLKELRGEFAEHSNWMGGMGKEQFFAYFHMTELENSGLGEKIFRTVSSGRKKAVSFIDFS
jgi:hypothetical protein